MRKLDLKKGDMVHVMRQPGYTAGGEDRNEIVTDIKTYYEKETGEPYPVICIRDAEFHGVTGYPLCPPWAYMIDMREKWVKNG